MFKTPLSRKQSDTSSAIWLSGETWFHPTRCKTQLEGGSLGRHRASHSFSNPAETIESLRRRIAETSTPERSQK